MTATSEFDVTRANFVKLAIAGSKEFARPEGTLDKDWEREIQKNIKDDLTPLLSNPVLRKVNHAGRL